MIAVRILFVDDDEDVCALVEAGLSSQRFDIRTVTGAEETLALLESTDFDVVVGNLNMRSADGVDLCSRIVANRPDIPLIVIAASGSPETAVDAIRAGAYDSLTKPFGMEALQIALERAAQHRSLRDEVKRLQQAAAQSRRFGELLGTSLAMRQVFDLLDRVSDSDTSVLIAGERGTGKKRAAETLHSSGLRPEGPFVTIDCAARPETLLERMIFGQTIPDAGNAETGLLAQADRGTLFLDEIGELPPGLQPKLLKALQECSVRPAGSNTEVPFDARIIAATKQDLETAVGEGRFRPDLYHRINVVHVNLPPLRSRGSDALLLAHYFLERIMARSTKRISGFSAEVAEKLLSYSWPGNVPELENCVGRAVALARSSQITVQDLPPCIRNYARAPVLVDSDNPIELLTMEEVEQRYVLRVLEATGWNKSQAAQILGMDRKTLHDKLERFARSEHRPDVT